ncbi:divalent metal cation transporter [Nonomuraea sp. NPDC050451]|uniref:divalent metal cation transporter n=1 Tax=Nonomuraea sp. NPDC050451 TaxID=3364364 RepID=UPI00378C3422
MKRFLGITLGILTAIGGFVDIGDLVANALVGSRFGMSLAWVVLLGVLGICVFAEMSGRIAPVSGRAVFDLVRERLGPKAGLANLGASFFILAMTVAAEIGGAALALELATGVNYLLWVPVVACAATVFLPVHVQVDSLDQMVLPVALGAGQIGLALVILGVFAATLGATLEVALSSGYCLSQYFGWQWGKRVRPREAGRFHATVLIVMIVATALILTTIDPIMVTEYSLVFSAAALPLTYLPVLMIANDRDYMGSKVNGGFSNTLGTVFMILLVAVSIAAIPLMLATKAGQ